MKSDSMKTVVVGASGRLGSSLAAHLREKHQVVSISRSDMDLASSEAISAVLEPLDFDNVIITGALTGVDYCETHDAEAHLVNAAGPGEIARIAAEKGAHVCYVSTDMVFDGQKEKPYSETDGANPISVYGATKLAGERAVLEASADNLVVRVSWVYGPGRPAFPEWIIDKACSEKDLTLPGNKICSPTYTLDLITWMETLIYGLGDGPASGIYHLCNSGDCTWREWGLACLRAAREAGYPVLADDIVGIPVDTVAAFVAKRPVNSVMNTGKFSKLMGSEPRPWEEALRDHVIHSETFAKYKSL